MPTELLDLRQENSKTFDLGGDIRQLVVSMGAVHYRDSYADSKEPWKDIDLTWEGNRITKAPYELTHEGLKLTIRDKRTGEVSTIELIEIGGKAVHSPATVAWERSKGLAKAPGITNLENIALDTDLEIVALDNTVRFTRVLKSSKAPSEAKFRVTGKFEVSARDATPGILNELPVFSTLENGILTETLGLVARPIKYPVRIDPSPVTIQPSSKDNSILQAYPTTNIGTAAFIDIYVAGATPYINRGVIEFAVTWGTDVPAGATITLAQLQLYYYSAYGTNDAEGRTFNADRLLRMDWHETQSTWNIYKTGSNWTTAGAGSNGNDYSTTNRAQAVVPAVNNWMTWDITEQVKTAQTGSINVASRISDNDETSPGADISLESLFYSKNEAVQTTLRPKLIITYTTGTTCTPGVLALTMTTYAPILKLGIIPPTLALTLTTYAPILKLAVTPATLALTLTTYAPSITIPLWYPVQVDWNNDGDFDDDYEDITSDVKSIHFSRGKSAELGKAEIGQATITLNNATGKYSPSNTGSVLTDKLLPKRPIKIRATLNGIYYNLFYGFIEEIIPHPHLSEQDCIITAVDGLDFLSRYDMATALYKNAPTGTIHGYILTDAGWSGTMRTLDTGQLTVPYWYVHDIKARYAQEEIDDNEQGFSYIDGAGYFNFEDRHHRSTAEHQTSQATFDNTMSNISYSLNPKNVYNIVKVTVTPWTLITPAIELWKLQETPIIPVGETHTYWGESQYFVDAWATLNSGDTDLTASGTYSVAQTNFAQSIKIAITNTDVIPITITLLRARGTYYDDQTKVTLKAENTISQNDYQKRTLPIDGKYITDNATAQSLCNYIVGKFKDPRAELSMSLTNQNTTILTQILSREISDRITIVNTQLGLNASYFIDYMEHDISMSGKLHNVTYHLADCINEDFWCLGYSKLGTQTKLGF